MDKSILEYREFEEVFKIIKKRIMIIILVMISVTIVAVIFSFIVIKPVYQADSTVIVGKANNEKIIQSEVLMYQDLLSTYSKIGKSRVVMENASSKLNFSISTELLIANIKVEPILGTQIIKMTYEDINPIEAARNVNVISRAFIEECEILLPSGQVKIIDMSQVPEKPIKPNKTLIIGVGFLCGFMLSISICFLMEDLGGNYEVFKQDINEFD